MYSSRIIMQNTFEGLFRPWQIAFLREKTLKIVLLQNCRNKKVDWWYTWYIWMMQSWLSSKSKEAWPKKSVMVLCWKVSTLVFFWGTWNKFSGVFKKEKAKLFLRCCWAFIKFKILAHYAASGVLFLPERTSTICKMKYQFVLFPSCIFLAMQVTLDEKNLNYNGTSSTDSERAEYNEWLIVRAHCCEGKFHKPKY